MHEAARCDDAEILALLLQTAADINAPTDTGQTALMVSVEYESTECLQSLLNAGANPSLRCQEGWTALHFAAAQCSLDILGILLKACSFSDVNAQDKFGETPLLRALNATFYDSSVEQLNVARLLIASGADVHLQNMTGQAAKDVAASRNMTGILQLLQSVSLSSSVLMERTPVSLGVTVRSVLEFPGGCCLATHEDYLANLGAHTKPALRTPTTSTSVSDHVSMTEPALSPINLLELEQPETEAAAETIQADSPSTLVATEISCPCIFLQAERRAGAQQDVQPVPLPHLDLSGLDAELGLQASAESSSAPVAAAESESDEPEFVGKRRRQGYPADS
eukprot:m.511303 g.511303  ORF g.511303 m.511303 type:complete len:337 (+) comp57425_c0_seq39:955-1965(+)